MSWCDFCADRSTFFNTKYYCELERKDIPKSYVEDYCKYDYRTYKCPFYQKNTSSSNCFISTIVCNILNKDDNDYVLEKVRFLRDEYLSKNLEYDIILKAYDVIGPILASKIKEDDIRISECIYNNILTFISKQIKEENYGKAIEIYYDMTLMLINRYNLKHIYNNLWDNNFGIKDEEYDLNKAGHGKVYKREEN